MQKENEEVAQRERDQADDALADIADSRAALEHYCDGLMRLCRYRYLEITLGKAQLMKAQMLEVFDETFARDWHRLTQISGSVAWSTFPSSAKNVSLFERRKRAGFPPMNPATPANIFNSLFVK
jgi:hypothetical protein